MTKKIVRRTAQPASGSLNLSLHPVIERIYLARGIATAAELERGLERLLPYTSLLGIAQAAAALGQAVMAQQKILIVGDFDADGATSTAVAVRALRALGAQQVEYLVPNRFEYGYGLTPEIVEVAYQQFQPAMIVTVDNGISSHSGVLLAQSLGIAVIVTDHHLPAATLPAATAIVNPNQPHDNFPSKNLPGVGVIFYVMLALRQYLKEQAWFAQQNLPVPNLAQLLDLVALGVIADLVPLDHNNRILVYQGLKRIQAGCCVPGMQALLEVAGRAQDKVTAMDLGFALGPRLNAAGRLDTMSLGIECLLCDDLPKARKLAKQLDDLNRERRFIEQTMQQQAHAELAKLKLDQAKLPVGLCLFDESWHQGVSGILAARIKDRWHRPVIIFAPGAAGELKGSARSISGLHIRDVLEAISSRCPGLVTKFGGHAMAAGLSLPQENYLAFAHAFDEEVRRHLDQDALQGEIQSDGELRSEDFTLELALLLQAAGPWGQAFPEPIFDGCFKVLDQRIIAHKHLKLGLAVPGSSRRLEAIAFNVDLEQWPQYRAQYITIAYRLGINEYNGQCNIQLVVEHLAAGQERSAVVCAAAEDMVHN